MWLKFIFIVKFLLSWDPAFTCPKTSCKQFALLLWDKNEASSNVSIPFKKCLDQYSERKFTNFMTNHSPGPASWSKIDALTRSGSSNRRCTTESLKSIEWIGCYSLLKKKSFNSILWACISLIICPSFLTVPKICMYITNSIFATKWITLRLPGARSEQHVSPFIGSFLKADASFRSPFCHSCFNSGYSTGIAT